MFISNKMIFEQINFLEVKKFMNLEVNVFPYSYISPEQSL